MEFFCCFLDSRYIGFHNLILSVVFNVGGCLFKERKEFKFKRLYKFLNIRFAPSEKFPREFTKSFPQFYGNAKIIKKGFSQNYEKPQPKKFFLKI